jgi:ankyrin repeat protein
VQPTPEDAKRILKLRGYEFNEKAFFAAVAASDVLAVNTFLAAGMNVNSKDETEGDTALMLAASTGDLPMVNALLKAGADINAKNKKAIGAFARALAYQHEDVAQVLLAQPSLDVNTPGPKGASLLIIFVWRDSEKTVNDILSRGANVNVQDEDGDTALHGAVVSGNLKILRLLLAKGANANARNKLGGTPLMWAGTYGRDEIAHVLIDSGADPRAKDDDGKTSAYWAGRNGHDELAKKLREAERQGAVGRKQ